VKETVLNDEPLYVLSCTVKASELLSVIYTLDDRIESYVDKKTLYPRLVKMEIKEGSRRENLEITIKERGDIKEAIVWDKKEGEKKTQKVSPPYLDIVSLIYWIRVQKLKIGNEFGIFLVDSTGDFKKVHFRISASEKVYTYRGVIFAFLCEQTSPSNKIKVWISQDTKRIPVQIQVNTSLGYLTAILREIR